MVRPATCAFASLEATLARRPRTIDCRIVDDRLEGTSTAYLQRSRSACGTTVVAAQRMHHDRVVRSPWTTGPDMTPWPPDPTASRCLCPAGQTAARVQHEVVAPAVRLDRGAARCRTAHPPSHRSGLGLERPLQSRTGGRWRVWTDDALLEGVGAEAPGVAWRAAVGPLVSGRTIAARPSSRPPAPRWIRTLRVRVIPSSCESPHSPRPRPSQDEPRPDLKLRRPPVIVR